MATELAPIEDLDRNILTLCNRINVATYELLERHPVLFKSARTHPDCEPAERSCAACLCSAATGQPRGRTLQGAALWNG